MGGVSADSCSALVAILLLVRLVQCCVFPEQLQNQTWYTRVKPSASTRSVVVFEGSIMKVREEHTTAGYVISTTERYCVSMADIGKYIVKNYDSSGRETFTCIEFVNRSRSIMQLRLSASTSAETSDSCDDGRMTLDPWLLVSYALSRKEFDVCPFHGGYNMKLKDSRGTDDGCNFMDLPMRFESECITGEGILFDFREPDCGVKLKMSAFEKTLCVTHWRQDGDVITVLRKSEADDLFCMRIPARAKHSGKTMVYLYTDLACPSRSTPDFSAENFTLELELVPQNHICADDHRDCERLPCNGHFVKQCLQTCGQCDPNVYPTACDFPKRMRGDWHLNENLEAKTVNISQSRLQISQMGHFDCVSLPGSPARGTREYTTITMFSNGCRPRFTCLGLRKYSPTVSGFKLSKSLIWPLDEANVGSKICDPDQFGADPPPIMDTYRPYKDVYKPVVSLTNQLVPQSCSIISSFYFNATFQKGTTCSGRFYTDCSNSSRMRMEFSNCWSAPEVVDYMCIGTTNGRYWEKIIFVQNVDRIEDSRCFIFSEIRQDRALMMPSGQCDKFSWTYTSAKMRTPLITFSLVKDDTHCHEITVSPSTTPEAPVKDAWRDEQSDHLAVNLPADDRKAKMTSSPSYSHKDKGVLREGGHDVSSRRPTGSANALTHIRALYIVIMATCTVLLI